MFFRRWREERWLRNLFRPYAGRDAVDQAFKGAALTPHPAKLGEVELIGLVVRIRNFDSILGRVDLRDLGAAMIGFYGTVADAIIEAEGDVNQFCGAEIVGHFNVLHKVEEARIVEGAMKTYRAAQAAFDPKWSAEIGVGLCRGVAIAGMFGSTSRITHTAFGPSAICAQDLAEKAGALRICEEFAGHFSRPQIPSEPWIAVERHWSLEGKIEA